MMIASDTSSPQPTCQFYIGTMGFSYKDWTAAFYPSEATPREYLRYYSRIFNAVEIDSTFYGTPRPKTVEAWQQSVPSDFRFSLKVPRKITHELVLLDAEAFLAEFLQAVKPLGEQLGVILFQFPPSFTTQFAQRLDQFLAQVPTREMRFAIELRDRSWYTAAQETAQILAAHAVCWAATQYPGLPPAITITSGFLYIRWIGQHGRYTGHSYERVDLSAELGEWWQRLEGRQPELETVFGFFNNDYAGFAPATANKFKQIAGLAWQSFEKPRQARLF